MSYVNVHKRREARAAYVFLAPWFIGLFVITIGPMLASLYLSFTDYNLLQDAEVGRAGQLRRDASRTPGCITSLRVTFDLRVRVGAAAAGLRARPGAGAGPRAARAVVLPLGLLPAVAARAAASPSPCCGARSSASDGLVNEVLGAVRHRGAGLGLRPRTPRSGTLILLHVWTFGAPMVIFLAGLRQIPQMLLRGGRRSTGPAAARSSARSRCRC